MPQATGRRVRGVEVLPVDAHVLDALRPEAMVVFCLADVRPLSGAAGYLDWRVCGALSRAIEAGQFSGTRGELMLLPATGRLGAVRLFVLGLGPRGGVDAAALREGIRRAATVLREAKVAPAFWLAPHDPSTSRLEDDFVSALAEELEAEAGALVERVLVEGGVVGLNGAR